MKKNHERILQLHSLLSKLLDSLSFEVCVNRKDENCISLLQILLWKKKGQIDQAQFLQLYRSWLQSKSIFDIQASKQLQIYPKNQLIALQIVQQNFMNVNQINKALQILNDTYNKMYKQKKPNNVGQLQQAERIFLTWTLQDIYISDFQAFSSLQKAFKIHLNDLRKQMCEVNGIVSLRGFKNYLLNLNSAKRTNYLQNLLNIFAQIENTINADKNCLPVLFDEVFQKWRNFPRFSSNQNKKNLQIYRRVFQQNQRIFYDEGATIQYFLQKYGEQFVKCFQIDSSLLRQFNVLMKQSLTKYIQIFSRISLKLNSKNEKINHNSSMVTHRKKQPMDPQQQLKLTHKGSSVRQRTPTKSQRLMQTKNNTRTPTKTYNNQSKIRKQFGSADKSKQKMFINRTLTPTRQLTPTKSSSRQTALHQSQAYTTSQKSAIKVGVQKDSFYNKMVFFRNKRVQSYEIVMKRLKGK